jgi:hypothetical protein
MLAPPYFSSSLGMPVAGPGALPFLSFLRARAGDLFLCYLCIHALGHIA